MTKRAAASLGERRNLSLLLTVITLELVLELFNTPGGVDKLNSSGVERMASVANIDFEFRFRTTRHKGVAATASNLRFHILRMNLVFHLNSP